jgi:methionyl-tRNA synthetase
MEDLIEFSDWAKLKLKTAKVLEVEDVAGKDKLYRLQIDLGGEQRQLVAGLKPYYPKEDLIGKTIIVISNLAPAKIAGIESQGMLLAVKTSDGSYGLLTTDKAVDAGTEIE